MWFESLWMRASPFILSSQVQILEFPFPSSCWPYRHTFFVRFWLLPWCKGSEWNVSPYPVAMPSFFYLMCRTTDFCFLPVLLPEFSSFSPRARGFFFCFYVPYRDLPSPVPLFLVPIFQMELCCLCHVSCPRFGSLRLCFAFLGGPVAPLASHDERFFFGFFFFLADIPFPKFLSGSDFNSGETTPAQPCLTESMALWILVRLCPSRGALLERQIRFSLVRGSGVSPSFSFTLRFLVAIAVD